MINHSDIRECYDLTGSLAKDFFCAFCCLPCDLTQQNKEVKCRLNQPTPRTEQPTPATPQPGYKPQDDEPASAESVA
jgi:hypothetical protein